jgi:hypothetical protein
LYPFTRASSHAHDGDAEADARLKGKLKPMTNFRSQAEGRVPGIRRCAPEWVWTVPMPEIDTGSSSSRVKGEDNIKIYPKKLKTGLIEPKTKVSRELLFFFQFVFSDAVSV